MPRNSLCMTCILRLPCWGCLFTWVPHSTLLRFFFSVCDHSCLCSYAPYGMPDWCSLCSSSQLNSSNLTTGICSSHHFLSLLTCSCWCVRTVYDSLCAHVCVYVCQIHLHLKELRCYHPCEVSRKLAIISGPCSSPTRMDRAHLHTYTHVYKDGHLWVSASKSMRYQFSSFHHVLSINICPQTHPHNLSCKTNKSIDIHVLFLGMQGSRNKRSMISSIEGYILDPISLWQCLLNFFFFFFLTNMPRML